MRRVSVVGNSGSGKSQVSAQLARKLSVPHIELDAIFHQPDWTPLPVDQFRAETDAARPRKAGSLTGTTPPYARSSGDAPIPSSGSTFRAGS